MTVTPPTIRQDLVAEEDYIEEIARIYGYDKLPVTLPKGNCEAGISYEESTRGILREIHFAEWGLMKYRLIHL